MRYDNRLRKLEAKAKAVQDGALSLRLEQLNETEREALLAALRQVVAWKQDGIPLPADFEQSHGYHLLQQHMALLAGVAA
jgi:hypothetical protein